MNSSYNLSLKNYRKLQSVSFNDNGSTLSHRRGIVNKLYSENGVEIFSDQIVSFDDYVDCQKRLADKEGKQYSYELKDIVFQVKQVTEPEISKIYLETNSDLPISGELRCRDPYHEWSVFQALDFGYFNKHDQSNFPEKQAIQRLLASSYVYHMSATYAMMKVAGKFRGYVKKDGNNWIKCETPRTNANNHYEKWGIRLNKMT